MIALLVLSLVALAQEPEAAGPPPGWTELTPVEGLDPVVVPTQLDEEADYEVTVWGELAVRQARLKSLRTAPQYLMDACFLGADHAGAREQARAGGLADGSPGVGCRTVHGDQPGGYGQSEWRLG